MGLEECTVQTFVGDIQALLTRGVRSALTSLMSHLWGERQREVSPEDWLESQWLCQPESPDFILDLPDYHGFFTCTMFQGRVRGQEDA